MGVQYKWNPDTGTFSVVGSKASERPVKEKQASLLDWGEDTEKLAMWVKAQIEDSVGEPNSTIRGVE
jgi:hypothetical protein